MPKKFYNRRKKKRKRRKMANMVTVPRSMVKYDGVKKFKLRLTYDVTTDAVFGNLEFHIRPNQLNGLLHPPSSAPIGLPEYTSLAALFDQYRVSGIGLKYIPKWRNAQQEFDDPAGGADPVRFGAMPLVAVVYDIDNVGAIPYENSITRDRLTLFNPLERWDYYTKIRRTVQTVASQAVEINGWKNLQDAGSNQTSVINFVSSDPIKTAKGNLLTQFEMGTAIVTCYLQCKTRQ